MNWLQRLLGGDDAPPLGSIWPALADGPAHQAPEVEAVLPASVAGRDLLIWSVRGAATMTTARMLATDIEEVAGALAAQGGSLDDFAIAIAGRTDARADPPYFIHAVRVPPVGVDIVLPIATGAAGWLDDLSPELFEERSVGGKAILVGTDAMLRQNDHQRGRPYWYEVDDPPTVFIIVTDDDAWAADALGQLP